MVVKRAFTGDHFKILMKTGEIIKPTFITKLFDADIIFDQQFAGMANPYFYHELRIRFPGPGFKITAKRIGADIGHIGYFFQLNRPFEIFQAVIINDIDPVVFGLKTILFKADG